MLHELLTGALPFSAASAAEMPHAIINDTPAPLPGSLPMASELRRIVGKCLAKDLRDRYQTARDLFLDLRHVQRGPCWSPDGSQIAFSAGNEGADAVFVVPAIGGARRRVVDQGDGLAWAPDGETFTFIDRHSTPSASE